MIYEERKRDTMKTAMARKKKHSGEERPAEPGTSEAYRQLEAEVRRRREIGIGRQPAAIIHRKDFVSIGEIIGPALDALLHRHGMQAMTPEEAEAHIARREEETRAAQNEEVANARWRKLCPHSEFRKPFDMSKVPAEVGREKVRRVIEWEFGSQGMFIVGQSGRAKTRSVYAMLKREAVDAMRSALVVDGILFATQASSAFGEPARTEKWIRSYLEPDILVIDDLAKRFTIVTAQALFAVLDRRTGNGKPVIITSNCSGAVLGEMINDPQLWDPTRRRIQQFCDPVVF